MINKDIQSLENVLAFLKGEPFDKTYLQYDVGIFDSALRAHPLEQFRNKQCAKSLELNEKNELVCVECGWHTRTIGK